MKREYRWEHCNGAETTHRQDSFFFFTSEAFQSPHGLPRMMCVGGKAKVTSVHPGCQCVGGNAVHIMASAAISFLVFPSAADP